MVLLGILVAGSLLWIVKKWEGNATDADSNKITAEIYQDGNLLYRIDLNAVAKPYQITVKAADGGENQIAVDKGSIRMASADCPDKLCVKQGAIHSSLLPITCLPHHLVIQVVEGNATNSEIDMISY